MLICYSDRDILRTAQTVLSFDFIQCYKLQIGLHFSFRFNCLGELNKAKL